MKNKKNKLDSDQIKFITNKVIELGSIDKVEKHYHDNDIVSEFALFKAKELFKPKRIKLKKGN